MQIYVHQNGHQLGPFTEEEIGAQLAAGKLGPQDLVWWEGQQGWVALETTPLANIEATPAPAAPLSVPAPAAVSPVPIELAGAPRTSGLAIGSLVCGILGFIICLPSLVAIILGHVSLREMKRTPGLQGRGMALSGLIMGYLGILIFLIAFAFGVLLGMNRAAMRAEMTKHRQAIQAEVENQKNGAVRQSSANQNQGTTNTAPGQ